MSDHPSEEPQNKDAPAPDWLEELRDRLAEWIGALLPMPEPMPVPVPVRR